MKEPRIKKVNTALKYTMASFVFAMAVFLFAAISHADASEPPANGPDPDFHIYLAFGQSNMTGTAPAEEQDLVCDDDLLVMCTSDGYQNPYTSEERLRGNWYKAIPPLSDNYGKLGAADYFGRTILEEKKKTDPGVRVGMIVVSVPGAGIRLFDKDAYRDYYLAQPEAGRGFYDLFLDEYGDSPYQRLIDCATEAQRYGVIKGIIMHQGEADYQIPGWADEVEKIYTDIVTDLELPADLPFVAGEMRRGTWVTDMNLNVSSLSSRRDNFYVASTEAMGESNENDGDVHFSSQGYRILGRRYAKKMLEAEAAAPPCGIVSPLQYAVRNITKGTDHYTLKEAFENADEDRHNDLVLLKDTELADGAVSNGNDLTLDMSGFTIDLKGRNILNYGKLSIVNSRDNALSEVYFAVDNGTWKVVRNPSEEVKAGAYDLDGDPMASGAFSSDEVRYVRVRGSVLYNGFGFSNLGGAVHNTVFNETPGILSMKNIGIVNCAAYHGGAVENEAGEVSMSGVRAYGCRAQRGAFAYNNAVWDSKLTIRGSVAAFCTSTERGTAVYNLGEADISGLSVYSCQTAGRGGAVCNDVFGESRGTMTIRNSGFRECGAQDGQGGAIDNRGQLTIEGSSVAGCSALSGGGIFNSGVLTIKGSSISGCTAGRYGGAVFNDGLTEDGSPGALIDIEDVRISGCTSPAHSPWNESVYISNSSFVMRSGYLENRIYINDNTASPECPASAVSIQKGSFRNYRPADAFIADGSRLIDLGGGNYSVESITADGQTEGNKQTLTEDAGSKDDADDEGEDDAGDTDTLAGQDDGNDAVDAGGSADEAARAVKPGKDEIPDRITNDSMSAPVMFGGALTSVRIFTEYTDAVTYTGSKIVPRDQLGAVTDVSDLASRFTTRKKYTPEQLLKVKYVTSSKNAGGGFFYTRITLDEKKAKKAGLKRGEIREIKKLIKAVNIAALNDPCYFRIVPLSLDEGTLQIKAVWKKKKDGTYTLKKVRSVKLSVTANGVNKTFTLKKYRDYDSFAVTDPAARTVTVTGIGSFTGTAAGVTVKK